MENIKLTFPDGSIKEFEKGSSAFDVAKSISNRLAKEALVAKVNGVITDMYEPLTEDAEIAILNFDDPDGKHAFWHSSSHLMAHAIKELYPEAQFGVGPAIEGGFYYDFEIDAQLNDEDLVKIENKMKELIKQDNKFVRAEVSKEEAVKIYTERDDFYKLEIISDLDESEKVISTYTEGDFTDLCTGPHIPSTGRIKALKLLSVSGSYWRGDEKNRRMQRIYGITFPKAKMLEEHLALLEEAKKRDHRKLGKQLDLFSLHEEAGAGMVYWHPKGARLRHEIETFWRSAHFDNGYELLVTPHIGKSWLWETSGHLENYKDDMCSPMNIDDQDYYIKPMNCPFHIMIYKSGLRSYRDLPLRWAELGTVYRFEKSGVLHGLMRVRGFTQDDAHIFCTPDQIEEEVMNTLRFSMFMWKSFGFDKLKFYIATKPEKAVGDDSLWDKATESLKSACEKVGVEYHTDEGGGAFYGPKIDIKVRDALNREWQMSTIQFDFNLPERFDMTFIGDDGKEHRPFMVHRALLGSIERFIGVLIEHHGGAFPVWLAPVQAAIVPVSQNFLDYAEEVYEKLKAAGIRVELDKRNEKIGYKIRDWETNKVPYMLIVGEKEKESSSVGVRKHKEGDQGMIGIEEFITNIREEINNKS